MATPQLIPGNSIKVKRENAAKLRDWAFWYRMIGDWKSAAICDKQAANLYHTKTR